MTVLERVRTMIEDVRQRIDDVCDRSDHSQTVDVVAVTKYASIEETQAILECGITQLGESKVQAAEKKIDHFGRDGITWHLIGHLQTNKVKKAVQLFDCIQSVDSIRVLEKIELESRALSKTMAVMLQFNIAKDPNKYGFSVEDVDEISKKIKHFRNVTIIGIMVMGPNVDDEKAIETCFRHATKLFDIIQKEIQTCRYLSMGMSHDFELAIMCGSNMLRLGSSLYKYKSTNS